MRFLFILVVSTILSTMAAFADSSNEAVDWSGIYVGAHGTWGDADVSTEPGSTSAPGTPGTSLDVNGLMFGPVIGINFQKGAFVYGLEGDASFGDFDRTNPVFTIPSIDIEAIGTIRGRVGVAYDRFLVFGTFGLGIASVESSERGGLGKDSKIHVGYVAGVGMEYAFNQNLIGRFSVMASNYEQKTHNYNPPHPVPHSHVIGFETYTAQIALIWKFGLF